MANPISLEAFAKLADKRIDDIMAGYLPPIDNMINSIFKMDKTDSTFMELYDIGSLPNLPPFTGKLDYLDLAPGYYTRIEPKEFAGGTMLQRKLIDDKKFAVLDDLQSQLVEAYGRTKEESAVKLFGNGFSSSWDFQTNEEGVSLFSASHTTKSGVSTSSGFSNLSTLALSKSAIAANRIIFNKFRTDIGKYYKSTPDTLVVPMSLYDAACEYTGYDPRSGASSALDPNSDHNRINTIYKGFKVIPWVLLDDYSTTNWFMIDSSMAKRMLTFADRISPELNTQVDFDTFAVKQSLYARFGWGFRNWRWGLGCQVS